jgi:hypothetical protein
VTALAAAARELLDWLAERKLRGCVIGGIAVQRWGEPRLTQDVDVTVIAAVGNEEKVIDALLARFAPRRADARAFALRYRVLLLRAANRVPLDVALGATPFEIEAVKRASSYELEPGCRIRTCSAEDLVIHKAVAGRPRDLADIEGIVARRGRRLDVRRIRRWLAEFSAVDGMPDFAVPLDAIIATSRHPRRSSPSERRHGGAGRRPKAPRR